MLQAASRYRPRRPVGGVLMLRILYMFLVLAALAGCGAGCQVPTRIGCECHHFYLDINRMIFGIDYPGEAAESDREPFYGLPERVNPLVCID
jgi:hypothetical protein